MKDVDFSDLHGGKVSITTNHAINGTRVTYNNPHETTRRYSTYRNDKNEIVVTAFEDKYKKEMLM